MRKGILDLDVYKSTTGDDGKNEKELMLGLLSALASSAVWLLVATYLKLPISGTHSIVGSTIGFSIVARGTQGLNGWKLGKLLVIYCWLHHPIINFSFSFSISYRIGKIIGSWFVSPVLSGGMSVALFMLINRFILKTKNPLKSGLWSLPIFYGVTLFVNLFSIIHDGPKCKYSNGKRVSYFAIKKLIFC